MANNYGISDRDEQRIRTRDKRCVYCGVKIEEVTLARFGDHRTLQ
jgi:hypothetical protein